MEEKIEENRVLIFGYSKSRLEVFLNGVIFLLIQIGFEVMGIISQLPNGWNEDDFLKIDRPIVVPIFLFIVSYSLMSHAIFGGEGRMKKMQEKYGTFGILLRKFSLIMPLVLVSTILPILITLIFFK